MHPPSTPEWHQGQQKDRDPMAFQRCFRPFSLGKKLVQGGHLPVAGDRCEVGPWYLFVTICDPLDFSDCENNLMIRQFRTCSFFARVVICCPYVNKFVTSQFRACVCQRGYSLSCRATVAELGSLLKTQSRRVALWWELYEKSRLARDRTC